MQAMQRNLAGGCVLALLLAAGSAQAEPITIYISQVQIVLTTPEGPEPATQHVQVWEGRALGALKVALRANAHNLAFKIFDPEVLAEDTIRPTTCSRLRKRMQDSTVSGIEPVLYDIRISVTFSGPISSIAADTRQTVILEGELRSSNSDCPSVGNAQEVLDMPFDMLTKPKEKLKSLVDSLCQGLLQDRSV